MNRYLAHLGLFAGFLLFPACIQQETTHSLYLSPDGQVVWTAIERDIRSDSRDPAERAREEQDVLDRVVAGMHPIGVALQQLGGDSVKTRMLRRERPYAVLTEARFASVELMIQRMLDVLKLRGSTAISREGSDVTLVVSIERPSEDEDSPDDSAVAPLVDCAAPYRFVLTEGRFVSALGFTLANDGAIATLDDEAFEAAGEPGAVVTLSLTWTITSLPRD
jgi:hypothetical protein